jgi:hypothetical protein
MLDRDGERSVMATLNAGRMGVSPADMTIQPKRKECLSALGDVARQSK